MKANDFVEILLKYENATDPIEKIKLLDLLCDAVQYPHFAQYGDGTVVSATNNGVDTEIMKMIEKAETEFEETDELYNHLSFSYLGALSNDDKKLEQLGKTDNNAVKVKIALTLKSDDKKIEWAKNLIAKDPTAEFLAIDVFCSVESDEKKEEYLKEVYEAFYRRKIIKSFKSDEIKKRYISEFTPNSKEELEIVESFQQDENKMRWMKERRGYSIVIIRSLKSDENKIKYLPFLPDELKNSVIVSLKLDELKLQLVGNKVPILVVESLDSDELKIQIIKNGNYDEDEISSILEGLKSDNLKAKNLRLLKDVGAQIDVLKSMIKVDTNVLVQAMYNMGLDVAMLCKKSNDPKMADSPKDSQNDNSTSTIGLPHKMTIGIEIETLGQWSSLARQFQTLCIDWHVKRENSISEGLEITSPVMRDNPEDINKIYDINNLLQQMDFYVDERCGGHIHIGADYLSTAQSYKRLIELWCSTEKIIYRICNKAGNKEREDAIYTHAKPYSIFANDVGLTWKTKGKNLSEFKKNLAEEQKDRALGINFANLQNEYNTVEFRVSNGTVDANTWIDNIRLFGRYVTVAEELGTIDNSRTRTDEDNRKAFLANELKRKDISESERLNDLLNLLFPEEKYRKIYEKRFLKNNEAPVENIQEAVDFGESYQGLSYKFRKTDFGDR